MSVCVYMCLRACMCVGVFVLRSRLSRTKASSVLVCHLFVAVICLFDANMHRCSCLYVSARVHVRECPRPDRGVCVAQSILMKHGSNVPVCVVMSAIEGRILTVWHSYCSNLRRISVSVCVYTHACATWVQTPI